MAIQALSESKSLTLPILKFSHTTTSFERTAPLGWTHVSSAGDLLAVFDYVPFHGVSSGLSERRRLKVLRGAEALVRQTIIVLKIKLQILLFFA